MFSEAFCSTGANMQDSKPKDQTPKVARLAGLDFIKEVFRGFLAHPIKTSDLRQRELIKIGHVAHQSAFGELGYQDFSAPFDVHGAASAPVFEASADLRRAVRIAAAPGHRLA